MLNYGFIRAWQRGKGRRVFPHRQTVHLSHGRGGLTQHARALNKSAFPPLIPHATPRHATPRHVTPRSLNAQAQIPPQPRPSSAFPAGSGDVKASPEQTRKQNPEKVKAGVTARAPAPGGARAAYVASGLPCHVSWPVRKWRGLTYKMAASFVAVRNTEFFPFLRNAVF